MCGIITIIRRDGRSAQKQILKTYHKQKSRGSDGFGYIAINEDRTYSVKRATNEKDITKKLIKETAPTIIFHHRFPTSTPNFVEATHPIRVSHDTLKHDYYVIHNGIIMNDTELKAEHNEQGYEYRTEIKKVYHTTDKQYYEYVFNDSESLAIELAKSIDQGIATIKAKGSIATVILQIDKTTKKAVAIYYGRNERNPLQVDSQTDFLRLASEGGGVEATAHTLFKLDLSGEAQGSIPFIFGDKQASLGYTTHTPYSSQYSGVTGFDDTGYAELWEANQADIDDLEHQITSLKRQIAQVELTDDEETLIILQGQLEDCDAELKSLKKYSKEF